MREIKFRAWDAENDMMLDFLPGWGSWEVTSTSSNYCGVTLRGATFQVNRTHRYREDPDISNFDQLIWLQYTGLKDKNGVEIYEDDILTGGAVVKWYNELTWDSGGSPHPGFYCEAWCQYKDDGELSYHQGFNIDEYELEVIGNIYENPELLDARP